MKEEPHTHPKGGKSEKPTGGGLAGYQHNGIKQGFRLAQTLVYTSADYPAMPNPERQEPKRHCKPKNRELTRMVATNKDVQGKPVTTPQRDEVSIKRSSEHSNISM